jgi:hypothetical protein
MSTPPFICPQAQNLNFFNTLGDLLTTASPVQLPFRNAGSFNELFFNSSFFSSTLAAAFISACPLGYGALAAKVAFSALSTDGDLETELQLPTFLAPMVVLLRMVRRSMLGGKTPAGMLT